MENLILANISPANFNDWANRGRNMYDRDNLLRLEIYGNDSLYITELKSAGHRRTTCTQWAVRLVRYTDSYSIFNLLTQKPLAEWVTEWGNMPFERNKSFAISIDDRHFDVYKDEKNALRVYSPFNLFEIYRPLKTLPKKWTIPLALRAIINKQYTELRCTGHYTDDYAYDDAVNYRIGGIQDNIFFAVNIIESPSGWHCSEYADGSVSISCHSFDCNKFTPKV